MGMKFSVCAVDRDLPADRPFPLRAPTYAECARIAREIGFDGIELQVQDPSLYDGRLLRRQLDDQGIACSAVTTGLAYLYEGLNMADPDPVIRQKTVERLKRQLDLAKELDSSILVGFIRGRQGNRSAIEFEKCLRESVRAVLDYAEELNTPFIMEQVNHLDGDIYCNTERTMQFLESFGSDLLQYNGDTYHMWIDDTTVTEAIERSLNKLVLFHVSDVGRSLPDDKHFDFYEAAACLKKHGYDRWTSIECKPLPDSYTCCKQGLEYLKRVFG